jgi:chromate reductase
MANEANKRNLADMPKVLAVSGSLRAMSFSTAILRALSQEEHLGITLTVKTLEEIPLYNEDLDTDPALTPIAELRKEVQASDGVVIATPEYNHGMPGVLKNALDWASRPAFASCFRGKPVLIITSASGSTGGVRAQYQLRETLVSMLAHVVSGREILLSDVENRIRDNKFTDADTPRVLARGIHALRTNILSRCKGEAS